MTTTTAGWTGLSIYDDQIVFGIASRPLSAS